MSEASTISVTVRGFGGSRTITLDTHNGPATIADVREAADLAGNLVLRTGGYTVEDESAPVSDEQVFVAAAPEAKHGIVLVA